MDILSHVLGELDIAFARVVEQKAMSKQFTEMYKANLAITE